MAAGQWRLMACVPPTTIVTPKSTASSAESATANRKSGLQKGCREKIMPSIPRKAKSRKTFPLKAGAPKIHGPKKKKGSYTANLEPRGSKKVKASLSRKDIIKKTRSKKEKLKMTAGFRMRELECCRAHEDLIRSFAGQWICVEGEEIVAHGNDPGQIYDEAKSKGVQVPFVLYIEPWGKDVARMGI